MKLPDKIKCNIKCNPWHITLRGFCAALGGVMIMTGLAFGLSASGNFEEPEDTGISAAVTTFPDSQEKLEKLARELQQRPDDLQNISPAAGGKPAVQLRSAR